MHHAQIKLLIVHFKMDGLFTVEEVFVALEDACSLASEGGESDFEGEEVFCYSLGGGVSEIGDVHEEEDTILEEEDAILEEDNDERRDQPVPTESRDEPDGEY